MREWAALVAEAEALGYTVELVEHCECADAPGILGFRVGVCIPRVRRILVREMLCEEDRVTVLRHELLHAQGAGHEIDQGPRPPLRFEEAGGILTGRSIQWKQRGADEA